MSYENTLREQAMSLGTAFTDSGKVAHVVGYSLINEILDTMASNVNGQSNSLISSLSDAAIAQLKEVLQQVSRTTFNEAIPMIKETMTKLQQVINPDIPVAYTQYEIAPVIFSGLWDTPMVMEMASKGRSITPSSVQIQGLIKSIDSDEYSDLLALAETGLGQLDSEVRKVFGGMGEAEMRRLFTDVFHHGWVPNQNPKELMVNGEMDRWVLIVLWCNRLYNMAPKESSFSLERYRVGIASLEELAFTVVAAVDSQRKAFSEAGRLVVERVGKKVYVINDLYAGFLAEGGTPEAILGLLLTNTPGTAPITLLSEIKQTQSQLESAWNRHVQISTVTHGQQMTATARRQLHLIMDENAKWHYGDDAGVVPSVNQGEYNAARDRIAAYIAALPNDFTRDAHRWVFEMVGGTFYAASDVSRLLTCLREVGDQSDSDLTAEEVKVLAVINFTGDWLADIIQTTDHGMGKMPARAFGTIATEALNVKTVAAVAGGVALAAVIGYATYKLISGKGSSKAEKLAEAGNKLEEEVKSAEQAAKEAPGRMVKASALLSTERGKNALLKVPLPYLEAIAKNSDFSRIGDKAFDSSQRQIAGMKANFAIVPEMATAVKSSLPFEQKARKVLDLKKTSLKNFTAESNEAYKLLTGESLPTGSVPEGFVEQLENDMKEGFHAQKATEEDLTRLFDNDKDIDLDKVIRYASNIRSMYTQKLKGPTRELQKLQIEGTKTISAVEEEMDAFREQLEEFPELDKENDEIENIGGNMSGPLIDFIMVAPSIACVFHIMAARGALHVAIAGLKSTTE